MYHIYFRVSAMTVGCQSCSSSTRAGVEPAKVKHFFPFLYKKQMSGAFLSRLNKSVMCPLYLCVNNKKPLLKQIVHLFVKIMTFFDQDAGPALYCADNHYDYDRI